MCICVRLYGGCCCFECFHSMKVYVPLFFCLSSHSDFLTFFFVCDRGLNVCYLSQICNRRINTLSQSQANIQFLFQSEKLFTFWFHTKLIFRISANAEPGCKCLMRSMMKLLSISQLSGCGCFLNGNSYRKRVFTIRKSNLGGSKLNCLLTWSMRWIFKRHIV